MLFGFIIFAYQTHGTSNNNLKHNEEIQNILTHFSQDSGFREKVNLKDVDLIYDVFYPYLNQNYIIGVCENIENSCTYNNSEIITTKKIGYDYYFADIDKTLYLIIY